jgi:hypothetical protein
MLLCHFQMQEHLLAAASKTKFERALLESGSFLDAALRTQRRESMRQNKVLLKSFVLPALHQ